MKRLLTSCCVCALVLECRATPAASAIDYPALGAVTVVEPSGPPTGLVIFLSGDGGWNKGVVDMARHLVDGGALVAGVDLPQMARRATQSHDACVNPAASLEGLSHYVQQKFGLPADGYPTRELLQLLRGAK